jgi:uncharacterized protein involved in exopolysaccharide biosynthesis
MTYTQTQEDSEFGQKLDSQRRSSENAALSLFGFVNIMLRNLRLLVVVPAVFAVGTYAILRMSPEYTAESHFMPQGSDGGTSRLVGLAAQFGFDLGGSGGSQSLGFYVRLLNTRPLLSGAVQTQYSFATDAIGRDSLSGTLVELYGVRGETPTGRLRGAIEVLRSKLSVRTDGGAGVVSVRVQARWPELAEQINQRLLDLVSRFNLETRQSEAAIERRFVEQRVRDVRQELASAEADLQEFLERNRDVSSSPRLSFEMGRLQRRISEKQLVATTLAQAYEEARIAEVRDTPVITILDGPQDSALATGTLVRSSLLALLLGFFVAVAAGLVRAFLERARGDSPEEYEEFRRLRARVAVWLMPLRRKSRAGA